MVGFREQPGTSPWFKAMGSPIADPIQLSTSEVSLDLRKRSRRDRTEAEARSKVRSLVHRLGSRVLRTDGYIQLTSCEKFPDGVITAFHGWQETLRRLEILEEDPSLITDGFYVK